ncbi:MAG: LysR family transcriptional regulator [Sutterella sp.]|nr:LysR family transcriptional regulator [Sutterella sp.]
MNLLNESAFRPLLSPAAFSPTSANPMRITLRQLSIFRTVYETRQVSKTARRLSLSVSAVSQAIRDLENALSAELFVRLNSGLEPTDAAKTLLPYATLIVEKSLEAEGLFADLSRGKAGRFVVGSNRHFGIYVLSRRLMLFKTRMPAVDAELVIEDNAAIEQGVISNRIDIGFISGPPASQELSAFPCFEDRRTIVAGLSSPYIASNITPAELSHAAWVLDSEERERAVALSWLNERGIQAQNIILMNTMGAIKRAVMTGLGLTVLPYLSVREEVMRSDLVEIAKPLAAATGGSEPKKIYAVFREERSPVLRQALLRYCDIAPRETV